MMQRLSPLETAWDPFAEFNEMRRAMNRLFGPSNGMPQAFPPLNIYAGEDEAVVSAEIPGIDQASLDISVHGTTFSLSGSRKSEVPGEGSAYLRQERYEGQFSRVVELPFNVDAEKVRAQLRNGILVVQLPRAESDKPRKITIEHESSTSLEGKEGLR